jgi:uncharacterized protein (TIGR03032 family)
VNELGINHVMRVFARHFLGLGQEMKTRPLCITPAEGKDIMCDEAEIERALVASGFGPRRGQGLAGVMELTSQSRQWDVKRPMRRHRIAVDGQPDFVLLASGFSDDGTGGGLYCFDGQAIEQLDRLSTAGLAVQGDCLARVLRNPDWAATELLVYDQGGLKRYYRVDGLNDPHDILWDGDDFLLVSTSANRIERLSATGDLVTQWKGPGEGDACHLNCLSKRDGTLMISGFGRFPGRSPWRMHREALDGAGFVMDVASGRDVVTGLYCPHHPRFFDGHWVVCDSARHQLVAVDASGNRVRVAQLTGWTRGIAVSDDLVFVGESAHRHDPSGGRLPDARARISILSRHDWTKVDVIELPCRELYDLALVSASLREGVRRGFATNPHRILEQNQYQRFDEIGVKPARIWATGDRLAAESCLVRLEATIPSQLKVDATVEIDCCLENLGNAFLTSAPPYPVYLSYKWISLQSGRWLQAHEGIRSRLPWSIAPKTSARVLVSIQAPPFVGSLRLRITPVQEQVAWFDDLAPENAIEARVEVVGV